MATDKRERQKANRQARLEEQRKLEQRENLTRRLMGGALLAALFIGAVFLYLRATEEDPLLAGNDDNTFEPELVTTTLPPETVLLTAPEPGGAFQEGDETPCPADDGSEERITTFGAAPPMCIDESASYSAVVDTDRGEFTIELDVDRAPLTVNNFVVLSRYGYYEGVSFHRIIPNFVVQGGDPNGDPLGTGGPGYAFADELPEEGEYQVGSVAMANSGPDTNGSQFFVVTGEQGEALPPRWSMFGMVTDGLDVVFEIESTGTDSGTPMEATTINSITIIEG